MNEPKTALDILIDIAKYTNRHIEFNKMHSLPIDYIEFSS